MQESSKRPELQSPTDQFIPKWTKTAVLGNLAVGAAEIFSNVKSVTMAVLGDGIHNAGDFIGYWAQGKNILSPHEGVHVARRRKLAHMAIAASSLLVAGKTGADVIQSEESNPNVLSGLASAASLALNASLYTWLHKGFRRRTSSTRPAHLEQDIRAHLTIDTAFAATALSGWVLQSYGLHPLAQAAGIGIGLAGAWHFRPTAKNLNAHNHAGHTHHHHKEEHGILERAKERAARFRRPLGRIAAAGVVASSLFLGAIAGESNTPTHHIPIAGAPSETPKKLTPAAREKAEQAKLALQPGIRIESGDGWYDVLKELRVAPKHWHKTLTKTTPKLLESGWAYYGEDGLRITKPGKLPKTIARALLKAA